MKKIITLLLTFAFVMSMTAMTAYAEDKDSLVYLDVKPSYSVTIPPTVGLTKNQNYTKDADIIISDVCIAKDKTIQVKIESDFTMTAENENGSTTDLAYTVTENDQPVENNAVVAACTTDEGQSKSTLTFSAEPTYAGSYTDTVIFHISID